MVEKVGRNDPCPCGSGKKYKNCCLKEQMQQPKPSGLGKRKFTAKVLSGGGASKVAPEQKQDQMVDYTTLMERSFGDALHKHEDKPPLPANPSEYLVEEQ